MVSLPIDEKLRRETKAFLIVSVFEIFFTWYTGMCLCSASQNVLFRDLENAIRAMRITHLSLTPTVAALVKPNNVPEVNFLVTAGEPLTAKVFKHWSGNGLFQGERTFRDFCNEIAKLFRLWSKRDYQYLHRQAICHDI